MIVTMVGAEVVIVIRNYDNSSRNNDINTLSNAHSNLVQWQS